MFNAAISIFKIPDLRNKVLFTIALLIIYRVGFHITIPGIDVQRVMGATKQQDENSPINRALEHLQMLSGGELRKSSLFGLGIMPYITASIILMLLGEVWPVLKKLKEEGQTGYKKIQEYTRYLTVPICLVQSMMFVKYMAPYAYPELAGAAVVFGIIGMTTGTIFMMWLGEQIDEYGIGNGISLLIMAGIVARMPGTLSRVWQNTSFTVGAGTSAGTYGPGKIIFLIIAFIFVVAGAILITQGQRRIPVQQAKQMRGMKMYGGQRHYLPLRINHGGVMPIIFASSLMQFPPIIFGQLLSIPKFANSAVLGNIAMSLHSGAYVYNVLYIVLIILFSYFWTTVQFQPKEMAKNLRNSGSFIPGLRPGHRTAEYLETVMARITFYGAAFLAIIAVVPTVIAQLPGLDIDWQVASFFGGTGLLIVVSVSLDLVQRVEANLIMRNYEGFSSSGRIKGARGW